MNNAIKTIEHNAHNFKSILLCLWNNFLVLLLFKNIQKTFLWCFNTAAKRQTNELIWFQQPYLYCRLQKKSAWTRGKIVLNQLKIQSTKRTIRLIPQNLIFPRKFAHSDAYIRVIDQYLLIQVHARRYRYGDFLNFRPLEFFHDYNIVFIFEQKNDSSSFFVLFLFI